jgi:hypothetical protein
MQDEDDWAGLARLLAEAARRLGMPAVIVMPRDAPAMKIDNTRALGAEIVFYDRATESREDIARRLCAERGASLVPSYDDTYVIAGQGNYGYNASTGEYGDMVEMGVLDPTKVTRTALQNAASVASLMLTTDCAVAELPKDDAAPAMPGGMGGMGGMDGMMYFAVPVLARPSFGMAVPNKKPRGCEPAGFFVGRFVGLLVGRFVGLLVGCLDGV